MISSFCGCSCWTLWFHLTLTMLIFFCYRETSWRKSQQELLTACPISENYIFRTTFSAMRAWTMRLSGGQKSSLMKFIDKQISTSCHCQLCKYQNYPFKGKFSTKTTSYPSFSLLLANSAALSVWICQITTSALSQRVSLAVLCCYTWRRTTSAVSLEML